MIILSLCLVVLVGCSFYLGALFFAYRQKKHIEKFGCIYFCGVTYDPLDYCKETIDFANAGWSFIPDENPYRMKTELDDKKGTYSNE